ncbi:MAG: SsrA-binding protein SmpB [Candidatus Hydrogenedentota bacterium]|uniref:SsrA-binding protein n=1 Tax=Sumerlaea chitinivorans TaxID=2250252 RepID=A0A2Z4Y4R5_SUMC1|nr:tmRNA-binding protein SmpB [Candidatus Sumerlaea chitinivorans]RMH30184.1 MAG: SsrA-binding protein SmpB [Candidatus Hydrogenedentota bacterium]
MSNKDSIRLIATNRRAHHDYHILDTIEAGLVLTGTEVKSLRAGKASLAEAYAGFERGEAYLYNMFINPYEKGNRYNHPERRPRKLLLHRSEINRLIGQVSQKGYTLVPLRLYFRGQHAKVELGLARGKKSYDKREDIKERDVKRELDRAMKDALGR